MSDTLRTLKRMSNGRSVVADRARVLLGNLKDYLRSPHTIWEPFIRSDIERLKAAMRAEHKGHLL